LSKEDRDLFAKSCILQRAGDGGGRVGLANPFALRPSLPPGVNTVNIHGSVDCCLEFSLFPSIFCRP